MKAAVTSLAETLAALTVEGELYEELPDRKVRCYACGHRCLIPAGRDGICRVRFNRDGTLYVPHGYFAAVQCDPIEKKPFFHALPGSLAMSFGMLGCDLHCGYCQNWLTSQALRDPASLVPPQRMTAPEFVALALEHGAQTVTSTYNEPLITSEWAVEIFQEARRHGLYTSYVSNGNGTPEVLDYLRPWVDFYKIDLKGFDDKAYRQLGGTLQAVLDTIEQVYQRGFWLEVVTLFVPGFNDSTDEMKQIARFLAGISPEIPWHCTAFHPDYKMQDRDATTVETLVRAYDIGREAGLQFVYPGNIPGAVDNRENTYCPGCNALLVERYGFHVRNCRVTTDGTCPDCGRAIPGRWQGASRLAAAGRVS